MAESGARRPIVIVEDDEDLVACLTALLEEEGYPVVVTGDGAAALEACARDPALVLVDLHLPGPLSGAELVHALRERLDPAVRVLLLTGERDVPRRAEELGVDGFLEKPFDVDDLLRLVERYALH
jgi:DNA-binding response OmpR family regulator